jgi:hypothetical protein
VELGGVGLALGGVVAGAFEMMDDRVYDERIAEAIAGGRDPEIPPLEVEADVTRARRLWDGLAAFVSATIPVGSAPVTRLKILAMYKAFYGLKRNPFEITPDPSFCSDWETQQALRLSTASDGTKASWSCGER